MIYLNGNIKITKYTSESDFITYINSNPNYVHAIEIFKTRNVPAVLGTQSDVFNFAYVISMNP